MNVIALDVETTGFSPRTDRITELCIADLDSGEQLFHSYFYPERDIPMEVQEKTRITNEMVRLSPPFRISAKTIAEIVSSAEAIVGYNPAFDRGMLASEFARVEQEVRWPILVCCKRLWDIHEPKEERKLQNAYKRFVDETGFEGAHGARLDVAATRAVFLAQRARFGLEAIAWADLDPEARTWFGPSNHLVWSDGVLTVNFGKNRGTPVHDVDIGFWRWLVDKVDFPEHVKRLGDWIIYVRSGRATRDEVTAWAREVEA